MQLRTVSVLFVLLLTSLFSQAQDTNENNYGWIRFGHLSADAPAVDIYVDDNLVFESISFKEVTKYLPITEDTHTVSFVQTGQTIEQTLIDPVTLPFTPDETYFLGVAGLIEDENLQIAAIRESRSLESVLDSFPELGSMEELAGFIAIHGLSDGPGMAVITQTGEILIPSLNFSDLFISPISPGRYPLLITSDEAQGAVIFNDLNPISLNAGVTYLIAIVGTPEEPELIVVSSGTKTLETLIEESEAISAFARTIELTNKLSELDLAQQYTIFVPTNTAFADTTLDINALLENPQALNEILDYHIVQGNYDFEELAEINSVETLSGNTINISLAEDEANLLLNGDIALNFVGIEALNGRIYLIDGILQPSDGQ